MDEAAINALLALVASEAPTIFTTIKALFASQNPGAPVLTDAQVESAFAALYASSYAIDRNWIAQHPQTAAVPTSVAPKDTTIVWGT